MHRNSIKNRLFLGESQEQLKIKQFIFGVFHNKKSKKLIETYGCINNEELQMYKSKTVSPIIVFKFLSFFKGQFLIEPMNKIISKISKQEHHLIKLQSLVYRIFFDEIYLQFSSQTIVQKSIQSQTTKDILSSIVSSLLVYYSEKMKINELEELIKLFQYESAVNSSKYIGIPLQFQKIYQIIAKTNRIANIQFIKIWVQNLKEIQNSDHIKCYHLIYLVSQLKRNEQYRGYFIQLIGPQNDFFKQERNLFLRNRQKENQNNEKFEKVVGIKFRSFSLDQLSNSNKNKRFSQNIFKKIIKTKSISSFSKCLKFNSIINQLRQTTSNKFNKKYRINKLKLRL